MTGERFVLMWIDGPLKVTITADYDTVKAVDYSFDANFTEFIAAPVLASLHAAKGACALIAGSVLPLPAPPTV